MISDFDNRCMELAIAAAKCWPDTYRGKAVGAVLVYNDEFISLGTRQTFHNMHGCDDYTPHAEYAAIHENEWKCKGATLYVTMEPCKKRARHKSWFPFDSCVEYIIKARIKRVVIGCAEDDPFSGGAQLLQLAGIEIDWITNISIQEKCEALMHSPIIPLGQEENLAQAEKELRNA